MADIFDQVAQEAASQAAPQGVQAAAQQAGQQQPKGDIFDQLAQQQQAQQQQAQQQQVQTQQPKPLTPEERASQTRQMAVSGLTGMPTPNMSAQDKAEFEQGKAAGAVSVPAVAGAVAATSAIPAAESFLQISENALEHLAENYPQLTKLASKLGYGVGAAGAYKLLNKLGIH